MLSFNKIAFISSCCICIYSGIYAQDGQYTNQNYTNQNNPNSNVQQYAPVSAPPTAAPVVYPQYYPASNAQTFPDSADFNNTYERNAHPPR